jgi:hypothetical protein
MVEARRNQPLCPQLAHVAERRLYARLRSFFNFRRLRRKVGFGKNIRQPAVL